MTLIRVIKPSEWEAIVEVKSIFGSFKQIASVLSRKLGESAHVTTNERDVIVRIK